jgi:2-iminobutanoate/2-iminopropanoate deaminase
MLEKAIVRSGVPETGGPFNMAVTFGPMIFVSGLPPFDEEFSRRMREARAKGEPLPKYAPASFEEECRTVMDHLRRIMEAAGSNMDCLLKVTVWLKDQTQQETFDRIYRSYFSSPETLPARTRMQAGRTPLDCGLEVDAIGYIPGKSGG